MQIHTDNLIKTYRGRNVVNGVNIEVNRGEVVGLLGPNGAGKTTTFYMVVGLVRPTSGRVFLEGEDITRQPMHKRAQKGVGYLPQEESIFRKLTVEENIYVLWELMPQIKKSEYNDKITALLEELGISRLRKQRSYELSGGERRRVEIARALACDPAFLLLDEPFTGIDPKTVGDIQVIIRYLRDKGMGILITDHSVRETLAITDRAYIIHSGKILISGNSQAIADDPKARELYLGESFKL